MTFELDDQVGIVNAGIRNELNICSLWGKI